MRNQYQILAEKYSVVNENEHEAIHNMGTGGGVADEFDNVLQAAGYPKSGYESAEIYNLIADYEKKVDSRDRNAHLYYSIAKALEWNEVDADLVADYLNDKAGASDNYHQDESKLEETVSKKKSQDMARVNAGAMSQAEFNAKYKRPVKKGLAGPGGLYKNLVKEESGDKLLDAIKQHIDNVQSVEVQTHYGNKVLPIIEVWVQDGVLKLSVDHSAAEVDEGLYGSGSGRSRRPYADRNDESNVMYIYDSETGHLMKRMVSNMEEDSARAEGYRQSPEDALRAHGIMRSKFNPDKYVKHVNGKWVEVFPYGKEA